MLHSFVNYYINSPERKKRRNESPSSKRLFPLSEDNVVALKALGHPIPKNVRPLIDISDDYLKPNMRMKKSDSIKVNKLWNWYQANVCKATQSGFTQWCGLGLGNSGMSKKLKNEKYKSDNSMQPTHFWYSGCQHTKKLETHMIHKREHPHVADILCGDCNGSVMALARDRVCNQSMRECMDHLTGIRNHNWPNEAIDIDVGQVLESCIKGRISKKHWSELNETLEFQVLRREHIKVHRYDVPPHSIIGKSANIAGASYPVGFSPTKNDVLENLNDGSYGLIVFPCKEGHHGDFVFIGNSGLSNGCIRQLSLMESSHFGKMNTERRPGPAAGQFIPLNDDYSYDPAGLSAATKNDRVYRIDPSGRTTVFKLDYWSNHSKKICHARVINKDIILTRITKRAKRRLAKDCSIYREKLISKMRNKFYALVTCHQEGLYSTTTRNTRVMGEEDPWDAFLEALPTALDSHCINEWRCCDSSLSKWDIVLLEWNCKFGEDLTHQATKCHVDGKGPETYSLWSKVASNDGRSDKEVVDSMEPGYVVFPLHGMHLRVRCGRDSVTMSLRETMHCGDSSRGRRNYSSIDWSRGK